MVSTSITASPDPAVEVVGQAVIDRVRALKAEQGKDVWLAGGGRLAASLVDEIDELILKVNPVVLGAGTLLFDGLIGLRSVTPTGHKVYPDGSRSCATAGRSEEQPDQLGGPQVVDVARQDLDPGAAGGLDDQAAGGGEVDGGADHRVGADAVGPTRWPTVARRSR